MTVSATWMAALPVPPKLLTSHTEPAVELQPGVNRRVHAAALSVKHCRKASQSASPVPASAQLLFSASRRAQRVQFTTLPPQQRPSWQALLWQSTSSTQAAPGTHGAHEPPQSTSVSEPPWTPSAQPAQRPATQLEELQSALTWHARPSAQRAQSELGPPQSMSVSSSPSTPS
jgi:hypothetical protein